VILILNDNNFSVIDMIIVRFWLGYYMFHNSERR